MRFGAHPTARRLYLHKRLAARIERSNLEGVWRTKQEAEPGTPFPSNFPFLAKLVAGGYSTVEDLDGATVVELRANVGVHEELAITILSAVQRGCRCEVCE